MAPIIFTINEACHESRTGRTALYAAIKSGELVARKRGTRTMILASDLKQWVESFPKMET
jgi:excisionase family DNA binding protein